MRRAFTLSRYAGFGATLVLAVLVCAIAAGARPGADPADFGVKAQETIQKSFALPAGAHRSLDIDNVYGSIEVTGGSTNGVQVTVEKTIRAQSNDAVERARKEVTLDITQKGGDVKLYVNGPFRCNCDDCRNSREDRDYVVQMDFKVQVPESIDLQVKTVNDGRVRVSNVSGDFLVRDVNGGIEMDSVAGSGSARTVNGPVTVSFRRNPQGNSEFRTINGNVELRFQPDLAGSFRVKTFNGGIYTDFPVSALPLRPVSEERHGGKVILRADRSTGIQVGTGGPEIQIENLNGDIRILKNHE